MGWPFAVALAVRGVGEMLASGFAALRVRLCGGTVAVLDDEASPHVKQVRFFWPRWTSARPIIWSSSRAYWMVDGRGQTSVSSLVSPKALARPV